jgi:hypothetical protein
MKEDMSDTATNNRLEESICVHIFSVSAAMVGVCLTVIGIIRIVIKARNATTLADDFLAIDAMLFLSSCMLAYWAMRKQGTPAMVRIERIADAIFIIALVFMVVICALVAFEMTWHETATILHHGQLIMP